jgi:hypothetical protein
VRAALILWLLCHPALGWSQQPPPAPVKAGQQPERQAPKKEQAATRVQQRPTDTLPAKLATRPPANEPRPEGQPEHEHKSTLPEWLVALATVGLVGVTAVLARYTFKLWEATKALAQDAKATADRQAGEVRESLEIGRRTVETMAETAERQLRAYVTVGDVQANPPSASPQNPFYVYCRIYNAGQTPAYRVAPVFTWVFEPPDFDPRTLLPLDPDKVVGPRSRPMLGPAHHIAVSPIGPIEVAAANIDLIKKGELCLYVLGTAWYVDAFKVERWTNSCIFLNIERGNWLPRVTEYGNDAD